jgi:hypothetical protein
MKRPKTKATKSLMDTMQELGQKYGVNVTDMSGRGVRAIGFLGGVGSEMAGQRRSGQKLQRRLLGPPLKKTSELIP